jgi:predicted RNA polymerase sigma factor
LIAAADGVDRLPDSAALGEAEIARIFREESGRSVATLIRVFGDVDVAEDAVQEAFAIAYANGQPRECPPTREAGSRPGA